MALVWEHPFLVATLVVLLGDALARAVRDGVRS